MFQRLRKKWNVSARQFWIIFIAFGCTGLTTAYLTKQIFVLTGAGEHTWWLWKLLIRIAMLVFGYQFLLLFFGAILGQWKFFWGYEKKLLQKLGLWKRSSASANDRETHTRKTTNPHQTQMAAINHSGKPGGLPLTCIAIFASGAGSNAKRIIEHFKKHTLTKVSLIVCNKPGAGVTEIAAINNIPVLLIEREPFFRGHAYVEELRKAGVDFIVLAGFLWKIPQLLIDAYPNKIINIHPALLPAYGGKGMYGAKVHEAVIAAGDNESGITIHYVDEHYDAGNIIFQARCRVNAADTPETLAAKIHALEHKHFPAVIEKLIVAGMPLPPNAFHSPPC